MEYGRISHRGRDTGGSLDSVGVRLPVVALALFTRGEELNSYDLPRVQGLCG